MSATLPERALGWARRLPAADTAALARAAREGLAALAAMRSETAHPETLLACAEIATVVAAGDGSYVAGLLDGAAAQIRADASQSVDVVWTGPTSSVTSSRLTAAVIAGLLAEAKRQIVLVSYASHPPKPVLNALTDAGNRGVSIVLLAERPADRPGFQGVDVPLANIDCTRLHWPAAARETGASLHAKVLIVDAVTALVGSANFTGHAMERNLECGLLVRGGPLPEQILRHLMTMDGVTPLPG
jgi:phosphatidylserine/phosphatidylglycerophosphate/cardiolipin synthase-like enzyme